MEANLEGRVALITGAGRGIGGAIARQLADRGVKVAVASRRGENPGIDGALARETDVRDYASVQAMVDATVDRFGQLDILVGNAGVGAYGPFLDLPHGAHRGDDRRQREGRSSTRSGPLCRTS